MLNYFKADFVELHKVEQMIQFMKISSKLKHKNVSPELQMVLLRRDEPSV